MDIVAREGVVHNKLMEFEDGLKLLQKENRDILDGADLKDACQPYVSVKVSGINYRKYIPEKIKRKVELLLTKIFE